jgi:hypothetical protein
MTTNEPLPQHGRLLGLRRPSAKPTLKAHHYLTTPLPSVPASVDHLGAATFGLDNNDKYGVCGPTSLDNYCRMVTLALTGEQWSADWEQDILPLYRRQNPDFDPATGQGDGGVDMKTMLADAVKHGFGPHGGPQEVLGFAELDVRNEAGIRAAVALTGGVLLGVNLQLANEQQLDGHPPVWDYMAKSGDWGGHAILDGAYVASGQEDCITWAQRVGMTPSFLKHRRMEAYLVILRAHLGSKRFLDGIDMGAFVADIEAITGRPFPAANITPSPAPTATADDADRALAPAVHAFLNHPHLLGDNRTLANAGRSWLRAKGL